MSHCTCGDKNNQRLACPAVYIYPNAVKLCDCCPHCRSLCTGEEVDPHAETAAKILDKLISEVTEREKSLGKGINFAILYQVPLPIILDQIIPTEELRKKFVEWSDSIYHSEEKL